MVEAARVAKSRASYLAGHLGITWTFRQPHFMHFHRRRVATARNDVSSGKPRVSSCRFAPCRQFGAVHDTWIERTPWSRSMPIVGGGPGGGRLARASFMRSSSRHAAPGPQDRRTLLGGRLCRRIHDLPHRPTERCSAAVHWPATRCPPLGRFHLCRDGSRWPQPSLPGSAAMFD